MPVHLRENWGILKDPHHAYLTNFDHPELTWWSLHPHHLFVLGMMDGSESSEAIAQQLSEGADIPMAEAAATVKEIERRFHHCLTRSQNRMTPASPKMLRYPTPLPVTDVQRIRNCAPIRLCWVATTACSSQCRYCHMNAEPVSTSVDLSVPFESLGKLADEARQLAVPEFTIAGGDPFILPGIIDVINMLVDREFRVTVGTKARVDCSRLSRNAPSYLIVEHSLDSPDKETVEYLTGRPGAYEDALANIENLANAGIRCHVKMVVGSRNFLQVPGVAKLCHRLGASSLQVIEYQKSMGRTIPGFRLNPVMKAKVIDDIFMLRQNLSLSIESDMLLPEDSNLVHTATYCGEGTRHLSFLSDGACTRCPSLPRDRRITAGNLFENGLYASWNLNDPYIDMVYPDRERYRDTDCYTCDRFDDCNRSGRCFRAALQNFSAHFQRDRACTPWRDTIEQGEDERTDAPA